LIYNKAAMDN